MVNGVRVGARVAVTGMVTAGVLMASVAAVVSDPVAPKAAADGLDRFGSCQALQRWYAAHAQQGGWVTPLYTTQEDGTVAGAQASGAAGPMDTRRADAAAGSATGTNTQERDVDEPDVAKTDGTILVRALPGRIVVSDVTGERPRTLSSYAIPGTDTQVELLLVGERVVVLSHELIGVAPMRAGVAPEDVAPVTPTSTHLLVLDVSDPAAPRKVSAQTFSGTLLSARQYGDVVRLVTQTTPSYVGGLVPMTSDGQPKPIRPQRIEARDWLPTVADSHGVRPLVGCSDVLHPSRGRVSGTIAVTGLDPAHPDRLETTALAASGQTVYSSADRIYVASTDWTAGLVDRVRSRFQHRPVQPRVSTAVHELDLAGLGSTYAASGRVAGSVRDRWSMDEHDGVLRLAVRTGSLFSIDDGAHRAGGNAVVTMARDGHDLVVRGRVDGLGAGEDIKSVRWFDDVAVVVTFRQLDPLYTVDLTDPGRPRLTGELKVPGFSGYLHPIGDDRLLGLGVDADAEGVSRGAQTSVFDLHDLSRPTQLDAHRFAAGSSLLALDDPRTFTWLPDRRVGYAVLQPPYDDHPDAASSAGLVLARIAVSDDGRLSVTRLSVSDAASDDTARVLPLPGGRAVLVAGPTPRLLEG